MSKVNSVAIQIQKFLKLLIEVHYQNESLKNHWLINAANSYE